jgi:hypothetical protein
MTTPHTDSLTLPLEQDQLAALGGVPLPDLAPPEGESEKAARKRRKREAKRREDSTRPPDSFERFRMLCEVVDEGRQVVELADHKARYSLVVIGALNAGVFFLMSRAHLFGGMTAAARPWLFGFMAAYATLTFLFVYYAVDCLRPRRLRDAGSAALNGRGEGRQRHAPRGVLFWETISHYELDAYRRAWSEVRMEELNAEVVIIAHQQAHLIRAKYASLGRLYFGLAVLIALAAALLAAYTILGLAG